MDKANANISIPLVILMTIASGMAVGNLYWAQPLLVQIANDLNVTVSDSGLLVTATQIGYALGLLLIVPLGDIYPRRRLIGIVMSLVVVSLLACALSPTFIFLAFSLSAMGITTVSGQIIIPMARDLADPKQQGRVVGIITAGMMLGILVARSTSGLIADLLGWRAIYGIAAAVDLVLMVCLQRYLPKQPAKELLDYRSLIGDVFRSIGQYKPLKWILLTNGMVFGIIFSMFWNAVTFLLSEEPFHFSTFQIGLVSLAGVTGVISPVLVGRLQDRGIGFNAVGVFIAVTFASILCALLGESSIALIIIAAALNSFGMQGVSTLSQLRVMALDPMKSSRLNTMFIFNNFACGAIGSALSGFIWMKTGWLGICVTMIVAVVLAAIGWAVSRKLL